MWKKIVDYYKIPEAAKEPSTDSARFKKYDLFHSLLQLWDMVCITFVV